MLFFSPLKQENYVKKNKQGICNTLCLYYYSLLRMFSRIAAAHERIHRNEDDHGTVRSGWLRQCSA